MEGGGRRGEEKEGKGGREEVKGGKIINQVDYILLECTTPNCALCDTIQFVRLRQGAGD